MQYRAASNRFALALPNALKDMRIGKARTTGPNTVSPHVYSRDFNYIQCNTIVLIRLHTTATALEPSNSALLITVK